MNAKSIFKKVSITVFMLTTIVAFQNCKLQYHVDDNGNIVIDDPTPVEIKSYAGSIKGLEFSKKDSSALDLTAVRSLKLSVSQGKITGTLNQESFSMNQSVGDKCQVTANIKAEQLNKIESLIDSSDKIVSSGLIRMVGRLSSEKLSVDRGCAQSNDPRVASCMAFWTEKYNLDSASEGTVEVPFLSKSAEISKALNDLADAMINKYGCKKVWGLD